MFSFELGGGALLRPYAERDAEQLFAVVQDNREMLAEWMPWASGQTLEGTREFIRSSRARLAEDDGFDAAEVLDGAIVGGVGTHRLDRLNRSTSVGYWLAASAQGRGLVTRATSGMLDHAFGAWGLHRVELRAGTGNVRSRAVAERLGFTLDGVLRETESVGGRWLDHAVYSMLADEWAAQRSDVPAR